MSALMLSALLTVVAGAVLPPCVGDGGLAVFHEGGAAENRRSFERQLVVEALPDELYWCAGEGPRQLTVSWKPSSVVLSMKTRERTESRTVPQPRKPDPLLLAVLSAELVSDVLRPTKALPSVVESPSSPPAVTQVSPGDPPAPRPNWSLGAAADGVLSQSGQPFGGAELFTRMTARRWGVHLAAAVALAIPLATPDDFSAQGYTVSARATLLVVGNSTVRCFLEAGTRVGAFHGRSSSTIAWSGAWALQGGATVEVAWSEWRLVGIAMAGVSLIGVHWLRGGTEFSGWHGAEGALSLGLARAF